MCVCVCVVAPSWFARWMKTEKLRLNEIFILLFINRGPSPQSVLTSLAHDLPKYGRSHIWHHATLQYLCVSHIVLLTVCLMKLKFIFYQSCELITWPKEDWVLVWAMSNKHFVDHKTRVRKGWCMIKIMTKIEEKLGVKLFNLSWSWKIFPSSSLLFQFNSHVYIHIYIFWWYF